MTAALPGPYEVLNQPPPLVPYDVFATDRPLVEGVERSLPAAAPGLAALGRRAGSEEAQRWATDANACPPLLRTHDRYGHRIDEVQFAEAWHRLLDVAVGEGLAGAPWTSATPGAHLRRAAGFYLWSQLESGHGCPVSMTYAAVPALRTDPALAARFEPGLVSTAYDPGLRPPAAKAGLLAGMAMTEKQGGSDVRANTTRAVPDGDSYRLTGHKWFCSAPMSDLFLVLAQAADGLTCFVVPRVLPDGTRNVFRLQRLKDKLGNRSNASAEIELEGTVGWRLGAEGRGIPTIAEMVNSTRLDCVIGSAALIRQAVAQATHHAAHRAAFGRRLVDQPVMTAVLADLALESEAATALMLRLAAAVDAGETGFKRLATAVAKYWVCKRAPVAVGEALECLGGNGYIEESGLPRLYREAPVNSIWEGSGNVNALDALRAVRREPAALPAYLAEVDLAAGADPRLDAATGRLRAVLGSVQESDARRIVEQLALVLQASLLVRFAPPAVADAFVASRLDGEWGATFGTLPGAADTRAIVARATPCAGR